MDLWYLPKEIVDITNYKYVIDIIDVFSKWIWSYPVYDKSGATALRCFRKYVFSFGKPNILHTDNGLEFKNTLIENFCNKFNITHIFSKPYNPKSTGCIEATHKQIKKFVYDEFYTNIEEEFFLEDTLLTIINYHNNTEHYSTKYKPADIKDTRDPDLIKKVNENISKALNYAIKYKNLYLLEKGEYLLVNNNITTKKNKNNNIYEIFKKNKKLSGEYVIPALFISYTENYRLKINITKDYKNIVKKDRFYLIDSDMCRIVSEKGYNYFFN